MLSYKTTFDRLSESMKDAIGDLSILAGDDVGPSDATWQDVAGTAAVNLRHLAALLDNAREGNAAPSLSFPSPSDFTL